MNKGKMLKYFTRTFRVEWSETNAIGQVHLATYFKYVVETAWEWGAAIGLGIDESEKLGIGWLVRATELTLHRPLRPDDVFELTIWLADWRRYTAPLLRTCHARKRRASARKARRRSSLST